MTIEEDGDVGIGITAPDEKLDVDGNLNVEDSIKIEGNLPIVIERFTTVGGTGDLGGRCDVYQEGAVQKNWFLI
jgi:hypothetical protein